jgi:GGDEF domain-containing protein
MEKNLELLPNVTLENGKNVAERIRNVIENREIKYDGKVIRISASLGVTQVKKVIQSILFIEELMRHCIKQKEMEK